jgi:hypothetical protein
MHTTPGAKGCEFRGSSTGTSGDFRRVKEVCDERPGHTVSSKQCGDSLPFARPDRPMKGAIVVRDGNRGEFLSDQKVGDRFDLEQVRLRIEGSWSIKITQKMDQ